MSLVRAARRAPVPVLLLVMAFVFAACGADDAADEPVAEPDEVDEGEAVVEDDEDTEADEEIEGDGEVEADADAQVLGAVSFLPVDHELTEPLPMWLEAVEEATDGQVVVDYDRGPESIPQFDQIDAVQSGVVDINFNVTAFYEDLAPELRAFGLSELTPWEERESGFYDLMVERHEEIGLRYLGRWLSNQSFFLWTEGPVERIEDFEGVRVRTAANYDRFLESMNAVPVTVETAEVYTALESGLVDAFGWPILGPRSLGWTEHVNYLVDHEFFNQNATILMNLDVWNALSPEVQDALIEATAQFERDMADHFAEASAQERELLAEEGIEIIELEDGDEYSQRPYDVEWSWLADQIPADLFDEVQATATQ